MLHHRHRQGLAGNPLHSNHDSKEDADFHFWGAPNNTLYYDEELSRSFGVYSPTLWKGEASKNDDHHEDCCESSPLLPNKHQSTTNLSGKRAIAEDRRRLMEMIQDMPESCYELSLKDIVDEQHVEETGSRSETEPQIKKKKKIIKARQMSRISSMESETFLLKMFFPSSLSFKKKSKAAGNCSNVSPRPSPDGAKHSINKEWWMSRFFPAGENKRIRGNSRNSSTSSNDEANFIPGCWSFIHSKKNKTKRQRGCIVGVESN
ncbi:hypothetical protein FH972_002912 [Carpinus fangiana]|uniref:Uncharacterized protein n=1 Tax=Carpinus fangiana TaxID=176857 RepID=A0A5N6QI85_9ROSI|nr:hypothetical protein FH972_002912 [Carpinus fangiana]